MENELFQQYLQQLAEFGTSPSPEDMQQLRTVSGLQSAFAQQPGYIELPGVLENYPGPTLGFTDAQQQELDELRAIAEATPSRLGLSTWRERWPLGQNLLCPSTKLQGSPPTNWRHFSALETSKVYIKLLWSRDMIAPFSVLVLWAARWTERPSWRGRFPEK